MKTHQSIPRCSLVLLAVILLFPSLCPAGETPVINNDEILKMLSGKLGETIILAKIKQGPCLFDTGADALVALKKAGATDRIIEMMIEASTNAQNKASTVGGVDKPGIKSGHDFRYVKSESIAGIKLRINDEKKIKGDVSSEDGFIQFESKGGKFKWLATDILAKYNHSWSSTGSTSFGSTTYSIAEHVDFTLPDGNVINLDLNDDFTWWGPILLRMIMKEAAYKYLLNGIESYQPSGGKVDEELSFKVLHVRPKGGLLGSFSTDPGSGVLKVSLTSGTVTYKDAKDDKHSFEFPASAITGIAGIPFVEKNAGEWFTDYWGSNWNKKEFGVGNEELKDSNELIISTRKANDFFVLPYDSKINGAIAPSIVIEYIVQSKMN